MREGTGGGGYHSVPGCYGYSEELRRCLTIILFKYYIIIFVPSL